MIKFCTSLYLSLGLAVMVALFCGLALRQQFQIRRKRARGFGQQGVNLLLAMLMISIIGLVIFIAYIFGPRTGC